MISFQALSRFFPGKSARRVIGPSEFLRAFAVLILPLCSAGCHSPDTVKRAVPVDQTAYFRPAPPPDKPVYSRVRRHCSYYISSAHDGSMLPHGTLRRGDVVMLRKKEQGGWADIQLMSGHLASVLAEDVGPLNERQTRRRRDTASSRANRRSRRRSGGFRSSVNVPPPPLPVENVEDTEPLGEAAATLLQPSSVVPEE